MSEYDRSPRAAGPADEPGGEEPRRADETRPADGEDTGARRDTGAPAAEDRGRGTVEPPD